MQKSKTKIKPVSASSPRHGHLKGWLFSLVGWPSPETTEWFCLRSALWWVIQLAPALHLFAVSPSFAGLARYGSEGQWQLRLGLVLVVQVIAVLLGRIWMRVSALFLFGSIWAFVAGMFWVSSSHAGWIVRNTGVGVYAALAVDCMIVGIHLAQREFIDFLARRERHRLQPPSFVPPAAT